MTTVKQLYDALEDLKKTYPHGSENTTFCFIKDGSYNEIVRLITKDNKTKTTLTLEKIL